MRYCHHCGKPANDTDVICTACGTELLKLDTAENTYQHQQASDNQEEQMRKYLYLQKALYEIQNESLEELMAIHKWIKFFGILTIISLVISIIVSFIAILTTTGALH